MAQAGLNVCASSLYRARELYGNTVCHVAFSRYALITADAALQLQDTYLNSLEYWLRGRRLAISISNDTAVYRSSEWLDTALSLAVTRYTYDLVDSYK